MQPEPMQPVAELLTTAFADDPLFAALFPDERRTALREWFTAVTEVLSGCRYAQIRIEQESVAVWNAGGCPSCPARLDDRLLDIVAGRSGPRGPRLLAALAEGRPDLPQRRWDLLWLAVGPTARGTGLGTAAVRELSAQAASAGIALYTETANPQAARTYRREGFVSVAEQVLLEAPGLRYFRFLRTPEPLASGSEVGEQEDSGG
jgi:ribosomal protein S18 acetylase RimI-like enzyme